MKKITLLLALAFAGSYSHAVTPGDEKTFNVRITKTVDGNASVKEETITLKEGEDIDTIVKKMEEDFTKDDKVNGKKFNLNVEVKTKDADGDPRKGPRTVRSGSNEKVQENGKTIKKETKIIITEE